MLTAGQHWGPCSSAVCAAPCSLCRLAPPASPCRLRPEFLPVEEAENKIAIANGEEPPHWGSSQNPQEAADKPAATGSSDLRALLEVRGWTGDPFHLFVQHKCMRSVQSSLLLLLHGRC